MTQIDILRKILKTPNIFSTEDQRRIAKKHFEKKCARRGKKLLANQTTMQFNQINEYGEE